MNAFGSDPVPPSGPTPAAGPASVSGPAPGPSARTRHIPGIGYWTAKAAFLHPHRTALVTNEGRLSYQELEEGVAAAAALLRARGVGPGDRFGILMWNDPRFLDLLFAAGRVGAVAVPLNWRLAAPELVFQVEDAGLVLLFVGPEQAELGDEVVRATGCRAIRVPEGYDRAAAALGLGEAQSAERAHRRSEAGPPRRPPAGPPPPMSTLPGDDDPVLMVYTSGTTGRPKGAVLTHRNLFWNAINDILALGITWRDTSLTVLPLMHAGGIGLFTLPTLLAGGTVVLPRRFDAEETLDLIRDEEVTLMLGVPAIHTLLVDSPAWDDADLSSLRFIYNGGDRCPDRVADRLREKGVAFASGYGLTETAPTAFLTGLDDPGRGAGIVGKPAFGVDARIVDGEGREVAPGEVGEVVFQGPNLFREYWRRPDATAEAYRDGWFHSGDLASWTEAGLTRIAGRKKQMLKSGGENIYPAEVEQALLEHPAVREACVIGRPHPVWNEVPFAVVALRGGGEGSDSQVAELRSFLADRLARYKIPKGFAFLDALPRTSIGKPDRPLLTRRYGGEEGP